MLRKAKMVSLNKLKKKDDLKELLSDCAKAVEMIDISNSEMNAAIRDDRSYLNKVMLFYNNGCKK